MHLVSSGSGHDFPNQSMMICVPGHPIVARAVELALDTIRKFLEHGEAPEKRHPGVVFGPGLLRRALGSLFYLDRLNCLTPTIGATDSLDRILEYLARLALLVGVGT